MRIFITGSTGYIGMAAAKAFRLRGHEVIGLARSKEKAHDLAKEEITPLLGDMNDPSAWIDQLENIDIYIHAGFDTSGEGVRVERKTLDALLSQAVPESLFIYTSGVWVYGPTEKPALETTPLNPLPLVKWRPEHEELVLKASCRSIVARPAAVYGKDGGLTQFWFQSAHAENIIQVGDGSNHWALVHVDDLAYAYVKMAFQGINKEIYNLADASSYTTSELTGELKALTGASKITQITPEQAREQYGAVGAALTLSQKISSEKAKNELGWIPHHPPLLADLKTYYEAWRTSPL